MKFFLLNCNFILFRWNYLILNSVFLKLQLLILQNHFFFLPKIQTLLISFLVFLDSEVVVLREKMSLKKKKPPYSSSLCPQLGPD